MLQPTQANARISVTLMLIVLVAAIVIAAWYFKLLPTSLLPSPKTSMTSLASPAKDLGGTLYNKVSNPVSGTLPSTLAPIPNPVNSFYANPFQ